MFFPKNTAEDSAWKRLETKNMEVMPATLKSMSITRLTQSTSSRICVRSSRGRVKKGNGVVEVEEKRLLVEEEVEREVEDRGRVSDGKVA